VWGRGRRLSPGMLSLGMVGAGWPVCRHRSGLLGRVLAWLGWARGTRVASTTAGGLRQLLNTVQRGSEAVPGGRISGVSGRSHDFTVGRGHEVGRGLRPPSDPRITACLLWGPWGVVGLVYRTAKSPKNARLVPGGTVSAPHRRRVTGRGVGVRYWIHDCSRTCVGAGCGAVSSHFVQSPVPPPRGGGGGVKPESHRTVGGLLVCSVWKLAAAPAVVRCAGISAVR